MTGRDDVLARTLQAARIEAGMSCAGLRRAAGIDRAEFDHLENGRLGAFASPERARLVVLAYCDAVRIDPTAALGRLEPYAARQLMLPPEPAARGGDGMRASAVMIIAGVIAWQAATRFADAEAPIAATAALPSHTGTVK